MKKLCIFLYIICSFSAAAQIQTRIDTTFGIIQVMDTSSYYDVFNNAGTLVKHNAVVNYAIPVGGYRKQLGFINPNIQGIPGYQVNIRRQNADTGLASILIATNDYSGKAFTAPFINLTSFVISRNGFPWKDAQDTIIQSTAILNPKDIATGLTLANNNLTMTGNPPPGWALVRSTQACPAGKKIQFEIYVNQLSDNAVIGIAAASESLNAPLGAGPFGFCYDAFNGNRQNSGNSIKYGIPFKTGDYITILVDMAAGTIATKINGFYQGIMFSGLTGQLFPCIGTSQKSMLTVNFGAKPFIYPEPGYTVL